jgi:hypothetical protein
MVLAGVLVGVLAGVLAGVFFWLEAAAEVGKPFEVRSPRRR